MSDFLPVVKDYSKLSKVGIEIYTQETKDTLDTDTRFLSHINRHIADITLTYGAQSFDEVMALKELKGDLVKRMALCEFTLKELANAES